MVRTALTGYSPSAVHRLFVQARSQHRQGDQAAQVGAGGEAEHRVLQKSEIAVLELHADDLPPQFLQEQYDVSLPEDTPVGQR